MTEQHLSVWLGKGKITHDELEKIVLPSYDDDEDEFLDSQFMVIFDIRRIDPDFVEINSESDEIKEYFIEHSYSEQFAQQASKDAITLGIERPDFGVILYNYVYEGDVKSASIAELQVTYIGNYKITF